MKKQINYCFLSLHNLVNLFLSPLICCSQEQSQLRSQEEEAKRKELSEKFQTTINDISEQMQENYKANQQLKNENNE